MNKKEDEHLNVDADELRSLGFAEDLIVEAKMRASKKLLTKPPSRQKFLAAFSKARMEDLRKIGNEFKQLMDKVGMTPEKAITYFQDCPSLGGNDIEILKLYDASLETGGLCAEALLLWGITPQEVYRAREAVGGAYDRMVGHGFLKGDLPLRILTEPLKNRDQMRQLNGIPRVSLEAEIRISINTTKVLPNPKALAKPLLNLLVDISEQEPKVFEAIIRQPDGTFRYDPSHVIFP